jgi:CheY-like chemotaxis protein
VPVLASGSPAKSSVSDFSLPTVLIVDDDPGFRLTLRGMLQGIAGQVLEAGGGREGLAMMRDALPEVAFVDLRMPDLDGTELLAEMNADPGLRSIAAIVVSGADLDFGDRLALRRAVAVRAKSDVNRETIREVLAEALGSRNAAT